MQGLREFIDKTMQEWKIPGLAIAIVKESRMIFCEGFGKRELEKNLFTVAFEPEDRMGGNGGCPPALKQQRF